jgi:hypothetical protein
MTTMAVKDREEVMRSPAVLKPLIEEQVELGYRAGSSFFVRAGVMLVEARKGIQSKNAWHHYVARLRPNGYVISGRQATLWMRLGRSEGLGLGHRTATQAESDPRTRGDGSKSPWNLGRPGQPGRGPDRLEVVDRDAVRRNDRIAFDEQRRKERAEMLLLIDAGYKAMAMKRHPDKGGTKDTMTLLKDARDILVRYAQKWS